MLNLKAVSQFKRDFKKYKHNETVLTEFEEVVELIRCEKKLQKKYSDHSLEGDYKGMRECHIKPDVLLIYWVSKKTPTLYLERIGSHSDLFKN